MRSELELVVEELGRLNPELAGAVARGDEDAATRLMVQVAALERRRNRLAVPEGGTLNRYGPTPPLREQVVRAARLLGHPASVRLVADVSLARYGEKLLTGRIASLRRDEERSWSTGGGRPVYVTPALSWDRFAPVRGTVALSVWPLEVRLVAPASPRVNLLHSTARLADEVDRDPEANWAPALRRLLWRLAVNVPDALDGGEPDPHRIRSAVATELALISPRDSEERQEAAERARSQLGEAQLLFGTPGLRRATSRADKEAEVS